MGVSRHGCIMRDAWGYSPDLGGVRRAHQEATVDILGFSGWSEMEVVLLRRFYGGSNSETSDEVSPRTIFITT